MIEVMLMIERFMRRKLKVWEKFINQMDHKVFSGLIKLLKFNEYFCF